MKRYLFTLCISLYISGCVDNYKPEDYYDPNAKEIPAKVIGKEKIKKKNVKITTERIVNP